MKRHLSFTLLLCLLALFSTASPTGSSGVAFTNITGATPGRDTLGRKEFIKLKIKDFEKFTGKKLTLKEKISFKIVQHKLKKEWSIDKYPAPANKGKTALILGIIGLVLLFVPYGALASIPLAILAIVWGNEAKQIDPTDKKARAAVVLGWTTLGLMLLFIIIGLVVVFLFIGGFF